MRTLFSLISPGILAILLAWPAQASMNSPEISAQRLGEPAHVQHERIRMQVRAVREHLKLRQQRADAAGARDQDGRSKSVEGGGKAAIER